MKAFTDLEQSKKLAEILPLESADMHYNNLSTKGTDYVGTYRAELMDYNTAKEVMSIIVNAAFEIIPCWSLAALINVLPADWWGYNEHYFLEISKNGDNSKPNKVCYYRFRKDIDGADYDRIPHISHSAENLIDACVNMIITLHEHKLLKEH